MLDSIFRILESLSTGRGRESDISVILTTRVAAGITHNVIYVQDFTIGTYLEYKCVEISITTSSRNVPR
jgi:AAA+ ATPase superfamily predicted ATPase